MGEGGPDGGIVFPDQEIYICKKIQERFCLNRTPLVERFLVTWILARGCIHATKEVKQKYIRYISGFVVYNNIYTTAVVR